jgi:hypothetical protein
MKTGFTKKIIMGTILSIGLFSVANAQTTYDDQQYYNDQQSEQQYNQQQYNQQQQQQYSQPAPQYTQPAPAPAYGDQSFYYYPGANVYYDINCNRYIYNNGYGWLTVNVLPPSIYLGNAPRYMVYHRGPQVWLDNPIHVRNFYRPAYRQPVVAYNNFRHDDFRRDVIRRDDFRRNDFRGGDHFNNHGGGSYRGRR